MMDSILAIEQSFFEYLADQIAVHQITDEMVIEARMPETSTPNILQVGRGGEATIEITGPLSMNGPGGFMRFLGIGGTSYKSIIQAANEAAEDEDIKTVRLRVNSPGGQIQGVDETWMALMALSEKKHVVAENHGIMASAAYWLASAADEIVATSPTAETGSIGVIITSYGSDSKYTVLSRNAPSKAPDIETKEGRQILQDRADALERIFIERVATGRGVTVETVKKKFGRGGVLVAEDPDKSKPDAISVGLIDNLTNEQARCTRNRTSASGVVAQSAVDQESGNGHSQEDVNMKLDEILAKHPELNTEIQGLVNKAVAEAMATEGAKAKKVSAVITGDFPDAIKAFAGKVLEGETDVSALDVLLALHETNKATEAQAAAIEEQNGEEVKDAKPVEPTTPTVKETGVCETNEDFDDLLEMEAK
jgi:ClpP class serine protease